MSEEQFDEMAPGPNGEPSYPCKVDGCEGLAKLNRGPTAYLCSDHIAARARKPSRNKSLTGSHELVRDYRKEAQELRRRADALDAVADAIAHLEAIEA